MARPTQYYVDPLGTASATGNDYEGASFTDGVSSSSGTVITKTGAFTGTRVDDKIFLTDNGSGDVTPLLYIVTARTDDTITVADVRSGAGEATDVKCTLADATSSLPFATMQFTLDKITRDGTNGDQINVKAGGTNTLEAAIDLTTYGTPAVAAPLLIRGYTSAADDGGVGVISGAATYSIFNSSTYNAIGIMDMRLTDCGANTIVTLNNNCWIIGCRLDTSTSGTMLSMDNSCVVMNCYFTNSSAAIGIDLAVQGFVYGNLISSGLTSVGMRAGSVCTIAYNIIHGSTDDQAFHGIQGDDDCRIINNSVYTSGSTKYGIGTLSGGFDRMVIFNNIVEGFDGVGGLGYQMVAGNNIFLHGFNAAYNNTTNSNFSSSDYFIDVGGDDIPLAASPFTTPGSDDFSVGDEVKATGLTGFTGGGITALTEQFMDMGAAQRPEVGGGGGGVKMAGAGGAMVG